MIEFITQYWEYLLSWVVLTEIIFWVWIIEEDITLRYDGLSIIIFSKMMSLFGSLVLLVIFFATKNAISQIITKELFIFAGTSIGIFLLFVTLNVLAVGYFRK